MIMWPASCQHGGTAQGLCQVLEVTSIYIKQQKWVARQLGANAAITASHGANSSSAHKAACACCCEHMPILVQTGYPGSWIGEVHFGTGMNCTERV